MEKTGQVNASRPTVRTAERRDVSPPLRSLSPASTLAAPESGIVPLHPLPRPEGDGKATTTAPTPSASQTVAQIPEPEQSFDGINQLSTIRPPDPNGDVGPNHYMQWVNIWLAIWDKTGNLLFGPTPGNTLFQGFGGVCEATNDGDPIVQYDQVADRWLASQFAVRTSGLGFYQCIAISTTGDPTGAWYRYEFKMSDLVINDYPKFGIWPDAYYMSFNRFSPIRFVGPGAVAFERERMLAGDPAARMVLFEVDDTDHGGQLPSDFDGRFPPPAGTPNYFVEAQDDASGAATDRLSVWEFHVDWSNPTNSTFGVDGGPSFHIDTAPFDSNMCEFRRSCIPQPDTTARLDAISDRLMYRLQYRNFGSHEAMVVNHTVDVDGTDHAGIRWYELRDSGSGWSIHQQGTWAPDARHRWMGSAAMDGQGNIAVGYTTGGADTFPSVAVAARLAGDPAGELAQGERVMFPGGGSQTDDSFRWGDYSSMSVDPVDDCTFWYTSEYYPQTSQLTWHTRIVSFRLPTCAPGPRGTLTGAVTDAAGGEPLAGATVAVGQFITRTDSDGQYRLTLPAGSHDVTVSAFGYRDADATGVVVAEGQTTTRNFGLTALPSSVVSGRITDGSGHGWPLYARIDISNYPRGAIFSDPVTGEYQIALPEGGQHTFRVTAMLPAYEETTTEITVPVNDLTQDIAVGENGSCTAPGYRWTGAHAESFDTGFLPRGWRVDNERTVSGWEFDNPGGRENLTGGSGGFAIMDNDFGTSTVDSALVSPPVDLSGTGSPVVRFNTDLRVSEEFADGVMADVDVSLDDGKTWQTVWSRVDESLRGPAEVEVPISQAAGEPDVRVRFRFRTDFDLYWWQIDNVRIGAGEPECDPVPGGLLTGHVTDLSTGEALDGATVTVGESWEERDGPSTTTGPTRLDPGLDDGFYLMFVPNAGSRPVTVQQGQHEEKLQWFWIPPDGLTRADFALGSGRFEVGADITEDVAQGTQRTVSLQVTNVGNGTASFHPGERGRDYVVPEYEPGTDPWIQLSDGLYDGTGHVLGWHDGKAWLIGGTQGSRSWVFDPDGTAFDWKPITGLQFNRHRFGATGKFIDGKLYVVGVAFVGYGWDLTTMIYDPATDSWSTGTPAPARLSRGAASGVIDGKLYVVGRCDLSNCRDDNSYLLVYDPVTDSWSRRADYPELVSGLACGAIDGMLYCAGGYGETTSHLKKSAYVYAPDADAWYRVADLPTTVWGASHTAANGRLLLSGGIVGGVLSNEGFNYDPATDTWFTLPSTPGDPARDAEGTCGFYPDGGYSAFFRQGGYAGAAIGDLEDFYALPGWDQCVMPDDLPWLSTTPPPTTLAPGQSTTIQVTLDATDIDEPGTYQAHLVFHEDTPHVNDPVSVTMNVTPAAS